MFGLFISSGSWLIIGSGTGTFIPQMPPDTGGGPRQFDNSFDFSFA